MTKQEFTCSIAVNITAQKAFEMISRVSEWWVTDVEGNAEKLEDEFTVHFGTTWVAFKITEIIPGTKIVWFIADCNLPWNADVKEWRNTKITWEVTSVQNAIRINFTHIGLANLACGNQCMNSWSGYIKQSLFGFITAGKGLPCKF